MSQKDDLNKKNLNEEINDMDTVETDDAAKRNEEYSIGDDRRVKSLSPGALVRRRFFRNRVAVVGLAILVFMFMYSPLSEDWYRLIPRISFSIVMRRHPRAMRPLPRMTNTDIWQTMHHLTLLFRLRRCLP
jgi:hypothetical protein